MYVNVSSHHFTSLHTTILYVLVSSQIYLLTQRAARRGAHTRDMPSDADLDAEPDVLMCPITRIMFVRFRFRSKQLRGAPGDCDCCASTSRRRRRHSFLSVLHFRHAEITYAHRQIVSQQAVVRFHVTVHDVDVAHVKVRYARRGLRGDAR